MKFLGFVLVIEMQQANQVVQVHLRVSVNKRVEVCAKLALSVFVWQQEVYYTKYVAVVA